MICSCTTLFLFVLSLLGTLLCCVTGIFALNGTLELLENYGPEKDRGNPALDSPPDYWYNPTSQKYEPRSYNKRGNFLPQVFQGIRYYLIALALVMFFNCCIFLTVATRSKKVVHNKAYKGSRNTLTNIGCMGWLAGYAFFLTALWLVMAGFAVLPLVEYVITMQRCWDLAMTEWSPGTTEKICVDLVQYGLVFFKETSDAGYGLICGPGGNYDPPRGDLEGFCANYYFNFCLYLACFVGACTTLLSMVLFAMRLVSSFVYLKVRRYENPTQNGMHETQYNHPPTSGFDYGHIVPNPNYEQNVLLNSRGPTSNIDVNSYVSPPSAPDAMELNRRYYDDEGSTVRNGKRDASRSASYASDYPVPSYRENHPPSYASSRRRHHDDRRVKSRRKSRDYYTDSDRELRDRYDSERSSDYTRSNRQRSRSTRRSRDYISDPDVHRSERHHRSYSRDHYSSSN